MIARAVASGMVVVVALLLACPAVRPVSSVSSGQPASGTLIIRQYDVGQGDAALVTTPTGRHILIDAGRSADEAATLLAAAGVDTIDLVIASHNHADHIGGMPGVLTRYVVRAYVENGIPQPTAIYRRTLAALEAEPGLQYLRATERTITIGSVRVRILGTPGVDDSQNNNSVGVVLEHGAFSALFTGDSELPALASWMHQGKLPRVTLVKVSHHGSGSGTSAELVRVTSPAIALISVGARNSYGHPSLRVEELWVAGGARVYRTDVHGTVEVIAGADGRFTVRTGAQRALRR